MAQCGSCEKTILQRKADCFWHTLEVTGGNSCVLAIESDGRRQLLSIPELCPRPLKAQLNHGRFDPREAQSQLIR